MAKSCACRFSLMLCLVVSCFFLTVEAQTVKAGDCPPKIPVDVCKIGCREDRQCRGTAKCCPTLCGGSICTKPVTMRSLQQNLPKPGNCPVPEEAPGPWVCTNTCAVDGDCRRAKKCCENRCGALACIQPVRP